jgi:hypothetical protein
MAERYIPEHRRTQFKAKNTFKPEELRRRREEQQVEIRKAKREENLAKRRGIGTGENRPGASLGAAPDSDDDTAPTESQVRCNFLSFFFPVSFLVASLSLRVWRHILVPQELPSLFGLLRRGGAGGNTSLYLLADPTSSRWIDQGESAGNLVSTRTCLWLRPVASLSSSGSSLLQTNPSVLRSTNS